MTKNFALEVKVKVIIDSESTCPEDFKAKIGLNGPKTSRVKL